MIISNIIDYRASDFFPDSRNRLTTFSIFKRTLMPAIYKKPTRLLMRDMVQDLSFKKGDRISKDQVINWFNENYPKIKLGTISAHLIRMSTNAPSRRHHNIKPIEDDLFYQIDRSTYRLYDPENDASPLTKENLLEKEEEEEEEIVQTVSNKNEFAYEKDLQNFLIKNLNLIEPGLKLFEDEGSIGVEYPVGGRFIDILALDRNNDFVVIELKVSRGYDRVVGQLLRYVSWIKKNQAEADQNVRGIIIAREISEDLSLACDSLSNVDLFEYQLSITLNKVE